MQRLALAFPAPLLSIALAACAPLTVPTEPGLELAAASPVARSYPAAVPRVDLLRVSKSARTIEVWAGGRLLRTITQIQLGRAPAGPKRFEGDGRTPEGRYAIDWRNPGSAYHLSLHISYPDADDVAFARARGRSAGGMIMIHGQPNGIDGRVSGDWTDGCIAVSDAQIEELWDLVPDGTAVEIRP